MFGNKNHYVFSFFFFLVYKRVFCKVYINFLNIGYTHNDIDELFERWSWILRANDCPMLAKHMKPFINAKNQPVIPHLIEEVPNFKAFVYVGTFVVVVMHYKAIQMHKNPSSTTMVLDGQ